MDSYYKTDVYSDFVSYVFHVPSGTLSLLGSACRKSSWTHFDQNKMIEAVEHRFYWSSLKKDVAKVVGQCRMCQLAKQ